MDDPFDERLEWDRDGQYFHYLTKWMHALSRVSRVTEDSIYNTWAIELAKTAHAGFTYVPPSGGQKRMYWKMSIDLIYPLVPSMGLHDPLDGFITYNQLQATAARDSETSTLPDLNEEIADMANVCKGKSWATDDPLGIGGLLCDANRMAQMIVKGYFEQYDLLEDALRNTELIVHWGNDPDSTHGIYGGQESAVWRLWLRDAGIKQVFIDPFCNYTAVILGDLTLKLVP